MTSLAEEKMDKTGETIQCPRCNGTMLFFNETVIERPHYRCGCGHVVVYWGDEESPGIR